MSGIDLPLILVAAFVSVASPGPAVLAIASASMNQGRATGLAVAAGVVTGSWTWSLCALAGVGAIVAASGAVLDWLRYLAAGYFAYLAYGAARRALLTGAILVGQSSYTSLVRAYVSGLALHLTNPKAILFFLSLYSLGVPADAPLSSLLLVFAAVGTVSAVVCLSYAWLFASGPVIAAYARMRRGFDLAFAVCFAAAAFSVLLGRQS